jgi:Putative heavy-metal-binding
VSVVPLDRETKIMGEYYGQTQGDHRPKKPSRIGADAVIGVDIDCGPVQIGQGGGMLMVNVSGTAVKF